MSIRFKIIGFFSILIIPTLLIGYFLTTQLNKTIQPINEEIPQIAQELVRATELERLSQEIRYYDEILTQSARNYAFTENTKWKENYNESAPILDETIKQVISLGDDVDKKYFQEVDDANLALVKMEEEAMSLVDDEDRNKAIEILEGEAYWEQKEIYKSGLARFAERRQSQYSETLTVSTSVLDTTIKETQVLIEDTSAMVITAVIIFIVIAVLLGLIAAYSITKPIASLSNAVLEITKGNLQKRVDVKSRDEIGQLAKYFNEMADKLQQVRDEIEVKVASRTKDLEKINKFMTGRELRMIELKKQLQQVEKSPKKK